jgi:hypothetical protein
MLPAYPVIGALLVFVVAPTGDGDRNACKQAAKHYEIAVTEVTDALRNYEKCIVASRGRAACSEEFSDLDVAQDQFETAVSEYEKGCR